MRQSSLKPGKGFAPRRTPMSRGSGFKPPAAGAGLLRVAAIQAKTSFPRSRESKPAKLKSSRPKMTPIRRAARGQDCTLQILGVCNGDPMTVVLCHSNKLAAGKGMGMKAPDEKACFGCSACHMVLDGHAPRPDGMTKEDVDAAFDYAVERTHAILRAKGLLTNSEATTVAPGAASEQITVE